MWLLLNITSMFLLNLSSSMRLLLALLVRPLLVRKRSQLSLLVLSRRRRSPSNFLLAIRASVVLLKCSLSGVEWSVVE
jgi:hypothetical protein